MTDTKMKSVPKVRFEGFTDDWEQRKLSDLTESHNSGVYIPKDQYGEGTNIIGVGDIYDSDVVDGQRYRLAPVKDKRFILHTNDLLYGESSLVPEGIARVVSVSEAGAGTAFAWHTRRFKVNQVTLNSRFLGLELDYWLPARSHLMRSSTKTALTGITTQDFFNTQIVFPSKPEQEKIATLINSLDTAIALHKRKHDSLLKLKQAYLQKMFPKNGQKTPELRFGGFTDDWEQRKLGDIAEITFGQSPDGKNYTNNPDDHILVQGNADIKDGHVVPRVWTKQVTKSALPGDLIFSVRAPVGDVGMTDFPVVLGRGVAGFKANKFVFFLLEKLKIEGYWTRYSSGSTFESVNSNDVKTAPVTSPSTNEQEQIGAFIGVISDTIALHQQQLDNLKQLKKWALQNLFV